MTFDQPVKHSRHFPLEDFRAVKMKVLTQQFNLVLLSAKRRGRTARIQKIKQALHESQCPSSYREDLVRARAFFRDAAVEGGAFRRTPAWRGCYALRRGLGTLATKIESVLAAKGLLRHKNIGTTMRHYIKGIPSDATMAANKISALFLEITSGRPN